MISKPICEICKKEFNSLQGIATHLIQIHSIESKDYYDEFLKKENEGICHECGNPSTYKGMRLGYSKFCSKTCSSINTDVRNKLRDSATRLWKDPEFKKNKSLKIKEAWTPERRQKMGVRIEERWKDPEYRETMSSMSKDMWQDPDHREVRNQIYNDPEYKSNMSLRMIEINKNPEHRKKISETTKKGMNEEVRRRLSNSSKLKWQNPDFIAKYKNSIIKPSKPQLELYSLIKNILPQAELEYPTQQGFLIDIAIPSHMIAFEYDGGYWHNLPGAKEKDQYRQSILESKGWSFIRYEDYIPSQDELTNNIYSIFQEPTHAI